MKRSKAPSRPKLAGFDERIAVVGSRYVGAALTGKLDTLPPEIAQEYHAAHAAREAGSNRHGRRVKQQHNWQSVYDLVVAADAAAFTGKIEAERISKVLATVEQTKDVKRARKPVREGDSAFIRWARRAIKRGELPPAPPRGPDPDDDFAGDD